MVERQAVWDALSRVQDPELGYSITELGLVYDVEVEPDMGRVVVRMTFTAPGCPYAPVLLEKVYEGLGGLEGVEDVRVDVVWDPPWDPRTMCSEDIRFELGLD